MNLDKSLYMADFMGIRNTLGTVAMYPTKNTLFANLYDDLKPKEQVKEVTEVMEEIEEKIIHLVKKADQAIFFPDLPELDEAEEVIDGIQDIKKILVSENVIHAPSVKTITLDTNYVPTD